MSTKAVIEAHADFVSIELNVLAADIVAIGAQMQAINPEAKMHGYNWEVFMDRYLQMTFAELRTDMECDSEAGLYLALYPNTPLGNKMANVLAAIINKLIANPEMLYDYMREDGDGVEWK